MHKVQLVSSDGVTGKVKGVVAEARSRRARSEKRAERGRRSAMKWVKMRLCTESRYGCSGFVERKHDVGRGCISKLLASASSDGCRSLWFVVVFSKTEILTTALTDFYIAISSH